VKVLDLLVFTNRAVFFGWASSNWVCKSPSNENTSSSSSSFIFYFLANYIRVKLRLGTLGSRPADCQITNRTIHNSTILS
jgi:hypothetical protein